MKIIDLLPQRQHPRFHKISFISYDYLRLCRIHHCQVSTIITTTFILLALYLNHILKQISNRNESSAVPKAWGSTMVISIIQIILLNNSTLSPFLLLFTSLPFPFRLLFPLIVSFPCLSSSPVLIPLLNEPSLLSFFRSFYSSAFCLSLLSLVPTNSNIDSLRPRKTRGYHVSSFENDRNHTAPPTINMNKEIRCAC